MINAETKKVLADLGKSGFGNALKNFLQDELEDIGDITKSKSWEETQGRQFNVKFIKKLLSLLEGKKVEIKKKINYE